MELQVEQFMKRQAELESGAAFTRAPDTEEVLGGDVVSQEQATQYCADIFEILRTLKRSRDMSVAEVKLVVSIEDPRTRERRIVGGIEDERGVSRDEMATALAEVAEGRVPRDRIALQCLHEEMMLWPFLDTPAAEAASAGQGPAAGGGAAAAAPAKTLPSEYASELGNADTVVRPYIMGQDARLGDKPKELMDMMPSWVGYSALYGISIIPAMFVVGCVVILFINSLN